MCLLHVCKEFIAFLDLYELPILVYGIYRHRSLYISDSLVADIHKKITDAFDLFDHESNKTVDVR